MRRLVQLVYERENGLRIMMKIHGLSDQAYWTISYLYYYIVYIVYISVFLLISTLAGLAVITENDYGNSGYSAARVCRKECRGQMSHVVVCVSLQV